MPSFRERIKARAFSAASSRSVDIGVNGDTEARFAIEAGGKHLWGDGTNTPDVSLYRSAADELTTDDVFVSGSGIVTLTTSGIPTASLPDGAIAVDTTNNILYVRSGGTWVESSGGASVTVSDTAPTGPTGPDEGDLWFESDTGDIFVYYSGAWIDVGGTSVANIAVTTTPPTSPVNGDLWFDTDTAKTYVYYNDGTSGQWVEIGAASAAAAGTDGSIQFSTGGTFDSSANLVWDDANSELEVTGTVIADALTVDTSTLHVDSTNNRVGIGTATPSYPLDVVGDVNVSQSITSEGLTVQGSATVASDLTVDTNTLHVDSTNNRVGIGTTTPSTTLHAAGSILSDESVTIGSGGEYVAGSIYSDANWGMIFRAKQASPVLAEFRLANSADTERLRIDSSGRVGIGTTTPTSSLDVVGSVGSTSRTGSRSDSSITLSYDSSENMGYIETWNSKPIRVRTYGNQYFNTNGTDRVTITTSGNVGIGTTAPGYSLDINGNAAARSGLSFLNGTNSAGSVSTNGAAGSANKVQITGNRGLGGVIVQVNQGQAALFNYNRMVYFPYVYSNTTGSGVNMHIATDGNLFRSTSSVKYKTEVEDLQDSYADVVLNLRPVWYRSLCDGDPEDWSYYGLIAEEVAEVEPRLVHFGPSADCACQPSEEDGLTHHEQSCLTEPEGVQYDRLVPHLISLAQRQNATIQELTARIEALEAV